MTFCLLGIFEVKNLELKQLLVKCRLTLSKGKRMILSTCPLCINFERFLHAKFNLPRGLGNPKIDRLN